MELFLNVRPPSIVASALNVDDCTFSFSICSSSFFSWRCLSSPLLLLSLFNLSSSVETDSADGDLQSSSSLGELPACPYTL